MKPRDGLSDGQVASDRRGARHRRWDAGYPHALKRDNVSTVSGAATPSSVVRPGGPTVKVFVVGARGGMCHLLQSKRPRRRLELVTARGLALAVSFVAVSSLALASCTLTSEP